MFCSLFLTHFLKGHLVFYFEIDRDVFFLPIPAYDVEDVFLVGAFSFSVPN